MINYRELDQIIETGVKMTKEKIKHYKKLLLEEKENIMQEIIESDESARDLLENDMHNVNDSVDEASSTITQTLLNTMNKNHQQRILSVEAALRRIDEGVFGVCISCGKDIAADRLDAVPWATKCIKCKMQDEKKH